MRNQNHGRIGWTATSVLLVLLVLAGCAGPDVPLATSPLPLSTDSTLSAEAYPDPPVAAAAYIPPPTTAVPEPVPTATPQPTLVPGRTAQGWGNLPRWPVVAPASDGRTLALYLVEGDAATQVVVFTGTEANVHRITTQLSPDGRHVACVANESWWGGYALQVVDLGTGQLTTPYEADWDPSLGKGAGRTRIVTALAWLDDNHILYSLLKVTDDSSSPRVGEVWLTDLAGNKEELLSADWVFRVLGVSPDGRLVYLVRFVPDRWEVDPDVGRLAVLDRDTGELRDIWPQEGDTTRYVVLGLVTVPGRGQRVALRTGALGQTVSTAPTVIWLVDPQNGSAEPIWTVDRSKDMEECSCPAYDVPDGILWSPGSDQTFLYRSDGSMAAGLWTVDMATGQERLSWDRSPDLLGWTQEGILVQETSWPIDSPPTVTVYLLGEDSQVRGQIQLWP